MGNLATSIQNVLVEPGSLAVFWLGGSGFAFKTSDNRIIYIDPYLSDALEHFYSWKRLPLSPSLMLPEEVEADLILITHAHEDHLDPHAIPDMATANQAIFAGPTMCRDAMREWGLPADRIVELNQGDSQILAGTPVSAVLAHHVSPAGAQTPDAVGFVLDLDGIVVYHTGDTLYTPDLQAIKARPPQLMIVCINGQYGNMNPEEAARLTAEIEPAVVIPVHWGLVAENTSDPADFVRALAETGSQARPVIMTPGDLFVSSFGVLDDVARGRGQ